MSGATRSPWSAVTVLASLYVFYNVFELAIGDGGWAQIVGVPLGLAVAAYGAARVLGWEGIER